MAGEERCLYRETVHFRATTHIWLTSQKLSCCSLRTNTVSSINVAGHSEPISKSVKLLGVKLNEHLAFSEHVNNTCHLCTLRHIRSSLTDEMAQTVLTGLLQFTLRRHVGSQFGQSSAGTELTSQSSHLSQKAWAHNTHSQSAALAACAATGHIQDTAVLTYKSLFTGQQDQTTFSPADWLHSDMSTLIIRPPHQLLSVFQPADNTVFTSRRTFSSTASHNLQQFTTTLLVWTVPSVHTFRWHLKTYLFSSTAATH